MPRALAACLLLLPMFSASQRTLVAAEPAEAARTRSASSPAAPGMNADQKMVFDALDLSRPELSAVAVALANLDYQAASAAWASHLRTRAGLVWDPASEASRGYDARVAAAAVKGEVRGGYEAPVHAFPDGEIDWFFNATRVEGRAANPEWQWQLNRMMFWPDMAGAYAATGDEQYARAFVRQLRSWLKQCPAPSAMKNQGPSAWRTIEAGIRVGDMWPRAMKHFLKSPSFGDDDILAFTRSVLEHARYLREFQSSGNWVLIEMQGLAAAGCFFPEFKQAPEWRAFAFERLAREASRQFLPDGAHYELSPGYHEYVGLVSFLLARDVARWTGFEPEIPASYDSGLAKAFEWSMLMSAPGGWRPLYNDSSPGRINAVMSRASRIFPDRDDIRWFATHGAEGRPPALTSAFLDWSGFAVMRAGWTDADNYLLFRLGPLGGGHWHQDNLDVIVWPYGRELLFKGNGGSYENSKWRAWAVSSLSANTVSVDGKAQARRKESGDPFSDPAQVSQRPIDAAWRSTPVYDYATGVYDHDYAALTLYGENGVLPGKFAAWNQDFGFKDRGRIATHRRSVLFLKPALYLVVDVLTPLDERSHVYQARWNLKTTETRVGDDAFSVTTTDADKPNLAIVPLVREGLKAEVVSGVETPEILGWEVRRGSRSPATTVLHTQAGAGVRKFITLLIPLRRGETNPVTAVRASDAGPFLVTMADGSALSVSADEHGGIEVSETLPDATPGRAASVEGGAVLPVR